MKILILLMAVAATTLAQADVTTIARVRASGDVTTAPDGTIYLSDFGNPSLGNGNSVVRISPDGTQDVLVGGLGRALAGNDVDSQGNLIQAGFRSNEVYRIDTDTGGTEVIATLVGPVGVAIDADDVIYVTQCQFNKIFRIESDTSLTEIATDNGLACPNGMDFGHDGALYVVNNADGGMYRVGLDGQVSLFANIPGGGNGHVVFVNGLYYVAGRLAHQVFQVDQTGAVSVYAGTGVDGTDDGPNLEATISRPNGIGASPDGRFLYVLGSSNFSAADLPVRQVDLPAGAPTFEINAGLAGAWYDPQTAGQGFLLDVLEPSGQLFAGWFTYGETTDGTEALIGVPEHDWYTALGPYSGDTATLTLTQTDGGRFDDPAPATNSSIGELQVQFHSCTEATVSYRFDSGGPTGTIELIRLSPDELCAL